LSSKRCHKILLVDSVGKRLDLLFDLFFDR
jgi:hypothetical protein